MVYWYHWYCNKCGCGGMTTNRHYCCCPGMTRVRPATDEEIERLTPKHYLGF